MFNIALRYAPTKITKIAEGVRIPTTSYISLADRLASIITGFLSYLNEQERLLYERLASLRRQLQFTQENLITNPSLEKKIEESIKTVATYIRNVVTKRIKLSLVDISQILSYLHQLSEGWALAGGELRYVLSLCQHNRKLQIEVSAW